VRKGAPYIPPGAPGHPRTGGENPGPRSRKARAPGGPERERGARPEPVAAPERRPRVRPERARLVYEDEDILAFDKPAGLPVIAADGSRSRSLLDLATEQVRRHNPKGRAAVVHRIDRDTSGTVVFATSGRIKKELMEAWDELVSERRYVALVEGSMGAKSGSCDTWLKENRAGQVFRAGIGEKGAKRAVTRWRLLDEGAGLSLLELFLETGRKHQIRVQLADLGHPVVGDPRYGRRRVADGGSGASPRDDLGRLCLHAVSIELSLPGRGKKVRIESPVPPEFSAALKKGACVEKAPKPGAFNAPRDGASASRSAVRSVARPRPGAPCGKKPSSRS
jgi:23S rRNA pseudouridine1911/1915/1917 synthase